MVRIFTPFALVLFSICLFSSNLDAQNTYVNNGSNSNYNLNNGDSLYISAGTFTGKINSFNQGAKITVAAGATFRPDKFNNPRGTLVVYGTAKFNEDLKTNSNFSLINYGTVWTTQEAELNGNSQVWINNFGGQLKFDNGITINNNNTITNRGTITSNGTITLNSGASFTNTYATTITGSLVTNGSSFTNEALFQTTGSITFNSGSIVDNNCRMIAGTGFTNNSNAVNNDGLMWAKAANGSGNITNSGTITNGATAKIKAVNFTNWGTVKGKGYFYFTGSTTNTGTVGVSGNTADTLKIYDVSRSNNNSIFDQQWGTVRPNAVYRAFAAPDTINNFSGCSVELLSNIPLPVKWNYFTASIAANVPSLNWSADQDPGTTFEVERSYNGTLFSAISNIEAKNNQSVYNYNDAQVNTQAAVVYYRIKAVEPDGNTKYSETRTVKFSNQAGVTIQAVPNPFTSQFSINYQTTEKATITIRVYSLNGQLQLTKNAAVSNGYNSIAVTEASSLVKGMYLVQISNGSTMVATEKLMKQ